MLPDLAVPDAAKLRLYIRASHFVRACVRGVTADLQPASDATPMLAGS